MLGPRLSSTISPGNSPPRRRLRSSNALTSQRLADILADAERPLGDDSDFLYENDGDDENDDDDDDYYDPHSAPQNDSESFPPIDPESVAQNHSESLPQNLDDDATSQDESESEIDDDVGDDDEVSDVDEAETARRAAKEARRARRTDPGVSLDDARTRLATDEFAETVKQIGIKVVPHSPAAPLTSKFVYNGNPAVFRSENAKTKRGLKSLRKLAGSRMRAAMKDPRKLPGIDISLQIAHRATGTKKRPLGGKPTISHRDPDVEWLPLRDWVLTDRNNEPVAAVLTGLGGDSMLTSASDYMYRLEPPLISRRPRNDNCGRNAAASYVDRPESAIRGNFNGAWGWKSVGFERPEDPIHISSDIIRSSTALNQAARLYKNLAPISVLGDGALEALAPAAYESMRRVNEAVGREVDYFDSLRSVDKSLYFGCAVACGRQTQRHVDSGSNPGDWATIWSCGNHRGRNGGAMFIPSLRVVIPFPPGTLILLRGGELYHEILDWEEGQRFSVTRFNHSSIWRHVGEQMPWSSPVLPSGDE